jgi:hypothetical protein
MTFFEKLALAQQVLRTQGGIEKRAILGALGSFAKGIGGLAAGAGKAGLWAGKKAVTNPMGALGVGLGALAIGSELKSGKQKARAYRTGFDPNVQAAQSTPQY